MEGRKLQYYLRLLATLAIITFLWGAPSTQVVAASVFDEKVLTKYLRDEPHKIFEHPKISCYISSLLPESTHKILRQNMTQMSLHGKIDSTGGYVFPGWIRGLVSISEGIVVLRPDGAVWIGLLNDDKLTYYTNQPNYYTKLPLSIKAWSDRKPSPLYMSARSKPTVEKTAKQCDKQANSRALKIYYSRDRGEICDSRSRLSLKVRKIVASENDKRAYFHNYKQGCDQQESCFKRKSSYLVSNDLVKVAEKQIEKSNFQCVRYTHESGRSTLGWIRKVNLASIVDSKGSVDRQPIVPQTWVGKWSRHGGTVFAANLNINPASNDLLDVKGFAVSGAHTGEVDGLFQIQGNLAISNKAQKNGTVSRCVSNFKMWRFNNAIYVSEPSNCGGIGVTFSGVYFKNGK